MRKKNKTSFNGRLKRPDPSYNDILGILGDAIAIFIQPHGELIYCNRRFQEFSEYTLEELRGKSYADFIVEDDLPLVRERFSQRMEGHNPLNNYEVRAKSKSGRLYTLDVLVQPYPDNHSPLGVLVSMRDITEKREQQNRLQESEEKHRTLVERTLEGVMILQAERVRYANPRMLKLMDTSESDITSRHVAEFIHPDDRAALQQHIQERLEGHPLRQPQEMRVLKKDGSCIYLEALSILITYQEEPALLMTCRDITDRKQQEERIQELIITDNLTGLFNRRHLHHQLTLEIERSHRHGTRLSLIMIDIDSFKHYNDTYGHLEGDRVLMRLAKVINTFKRRYDSGFRFGGEEFVVLCPGIEGRQALIVSERLRSRFENERFDQRKNGSIAVTISLGVTSLKVDDSIENFIRRADEAMYTSKRLGKNRSTLYLKDDCSEEPSQPGIKRDDPPLS